MPTLSMKDGSEKLLDSFTIRIIDAIALCHAIDGFEIFIVDLAKFSKGIKGYSNLDNLYKYIKDGKKVNKHIRDFYCKHYRVLDAIHKNAYISNFLLIYFDNKTGKFNQEIMQMYKYLKDNKKDKDKILAVLDKLSKLGFKNITFSENVNFESVYEFDKLNSHYYYYLDGKLDVIPSIQNVKYQSEDANYEIKMSTIPLHSPEITLNNLVFDVNCLPNEICYDQTMGKILELKEKKKESFDVLKDAVCFDGYIENIVYFLDKLDKLIINIHNCNSKSQTQMHIDTAKQSIAELQWILTNYEDGLIDKELISQDVLTKEKEKYNRRYNS